MTGEQRTREKQLREAFDAEKQAALDAANEEKDRQLNAAREEFNAALQQVLVFYITYMHIISVLII